MMTKILSDQFHQGREAYDGGQSVASFIQDIERVSLEMDSDSLVPGHQVDDFIGSRVIGFIDGIVSDIREAAGRKV